MKTWLLGFSDLNPIQRKVVELPPKENGFVIGAPGSGKTQVLVHRASYLIESHGISPSDIKLFVLTDVVKELVKSEIMKLDLSGKMVVTFENWCRSFYVEHISQDLPRIYVNGRVDDKNTQSAVLDILKRNASLQKCLKYALVDDRQERIPEAYEILVLAGRYITVIADPHQRLHPGGSSESFILNKLGLSKGNLFLQGDFRSSPGVAQLASLMIERKKLRKTYLSQDRIEQRSSETPLCFIASSEEKELDQLSQVVRQRQALKDSVLILLPTNSLVHRVAKNLKDRGIETEKAIALDAQNVIQARYDLGNNLPKITTYNMAKGLTFDSVLMPQLTENAFDKIPPSLRYRILFVGIARASRWVYLSTIKGQEFREMDALKAAEKKDQLRILNRIGPFR